MGAVTGVFIHPRIFVRQRVGGISRIFVELARELSVLGLQVETTAPLYRTESLQRSVLQVGRRVPQALDGRGGGRLAEYAAVLSSARRARQLSVGSGFVWHETYPGPSARVEVPRVVTAYDLIYERYPQLFSDAADQLRLKERSYASADAIIAISADTAQKLIEWYAIDPSIVSVVPLAVDRQVFRPVDDVGDRTATTPARLALLHVGNRTEYKNFSLLLRAVGTSSALRSTCSIRSVGGGPPTSRELAEIERYRLDDAVEFVGGLSDQLLAREYQHASITVCPSTEEGFGLPVLEAMASGSPVVASDAGAHVEVAGGAARHFVRDDACSLASALENVTGDATERQRLRSAGLRRAHQFSWQRTAMETLSAYESAMARHR